MKMKLKVKRFIMKGRLWVDNRGFGMNELLGIAAALIIAGFIIIPGLKGLAADIMKELEDWWDGIVDKVFSV